MQPLTPDTNALPFLVVHGGWLWIVLVFALALVIVGLVAAGRSLCGHHQSRWTGHVAVCVIALIASFVSLHIVGSHLVERDKKRDYRLGDGGPLRVGEADALSLAASLPGSRDDALARLADVLKMHPYRDDESVRRQLGLDYMINGRCGTLSLLRARPVEQLAMAERCKYGKAQLDILMELGRYDDAWNAWPSGLDWPARKGTLAIILGKWSEAAQQADEMAKLYLDDAKLNREDAKYRLVDALRYRCLAQWFRLLGGESGAAENLRTLAEDSRNPVTVCAPMVSQTLPVEQRVAYLRHVLAVADDRDRDPLLKGWFLTETMLWLEGVDIEHGRRLPFELLVADTHLHVRGWLAAFGVDRWRGTNDPENLALAFGGVVVRAINRGDFDAARRAARAAAEAVRAVDGYVKDEVRSWFTLIALRDGDVELPAPGYVDTYDESLKVRRGQQPAYGMGGYPTPCDDRLRSAVTAAQHGDGRPLAAAMQACTVYYASSVPALIGVLPRVRQGRDELATALRWWTDEFGLDGFEPFSSVSYAAARRDIARFVGDDASATQWADIALRCEAPLEDPTKTLALVLWND